MLKYIRLIVSRKCFYRKKNEFVNKNGCLLKTALKSSINRPTERPCE
jgi:hypothetical protein